jgi:Holliday junction DNA helicase RuvA
MIGYLEGTLVHSAHNYIIVKVGGVGYKVFAVPELLTKTVGEPISLFTYHKSSDDGQSLFGLPNAGSLDFFEMLLSVSGVGPKIALTILSSGDIHSQKEAIGSGDASFFSQMSGVGKKTAERIIVELRDKIGVIDGPGAGTTGSSDVFDALVGLGYSTYEVRKVLGDVDRSIGTEEQLKQALKLLSR